MPQSRGSSRGATMPAVRSSKRSRRSNVGRGSSASMPPQCRLQSLSASCRRVPTRNTYRCGDGTQRCEQAVYLLSRSSSNEEAQSTLIPSARGYIACETASSDASTKSNSPDASPHDTKSSQPLESVCGIMSSQSNAERHDPTFAMTEDFFYFRYR